MGKSGEFTDIKDTTVLRRTGQYSVSEGGSDEGNSLSVSLFPLKCN